MTHISRLHLYVVALSALVTAFHASAASDPLAAGGCKPLDEIKRLQTELPIKIALAYEGHSIWLPQYADYRLNFGLYTIDGKSHAVLLLRDMPVGQTSTQGCVLWWSDNPVGELVNPGGSRAIELSPVKYDLRAARKVCADMLPAMAKKFADQEVVVGGVRMTKKDELRSGRSVVGKNIEEAERQDRREFAERVETTKRDGDFWCDAFPGVVKRMAERGEKPTLYLKGTLWPKTEPVPGVLTVFTAIKAADRNWSMYYRMNNGTTFLIGWGQKYDSVPALLPK